MQRQHSIFHTFAPNNARTRELFRGCPTLDDITCALPELPLPTWNSLKVASRNVVLPALNICANAVSWGTLAVGGYTSFAPDYKQNTYTCEFGYQNGYSPAAATFAYDQGIFIFFSTMGVRIAASTLYFMVDQLSRLIREKPMIPQETVDRILHIESSILDVLSNSLLLKYLIDDGQKLFDYSHPVRYTLYGCLATTPMAFPLVRYFSRDDNQSYPESPTFAAIDQAFPDKSTLFKVGVKTAETINMQFLISGAAFAWVWFVIDNLYDGTHETDYKNTNKALIITALVGLLLAPLTMFKEKAYSWSSKIANTMNSAYAPAMSLLSTDLCMNLQQNDEDPNQYKNSGVYSAVAFAMFAIGLAASHEYMKHHTEQLLKVPTKTTEPEQPPELQAPSSPREEDDLTIQTINEEMIIPIAKKSPIFTGRLASSPFGTFSHMDEKSDEDQPTKTKTFSPTRGSDHES